AAPGRAHGASRSRRRYNSSSPPRRSSAHAARCADSSRGRAPPGRLPLSGSKGSSLGPELVASWRGPPARVEAVSLEQRHDDALQAEAQARRVGDLAVLGADVERRAEVLLMEVE